MHNLVEENKERRKVIQKRMKIAKQYGILKHNLMKTIRKHLFELLQEKALIKNCQRKYLVIISLFLICNILWKQLLEKRRYH